jgi:hypothetical protein
MTLTTEAEVEVLDPLDTTVIDIALTAKEVYMVLSCLYFDTVNPPLDVLELIKDIEGRLLDNDLPVTQQEFDSEYLNNHEDNPQYKRIIFGMPETP